MSFPKKITFRELALREGYQSFKKVYPTEQKLEFFRHILSTGAPHIEVSSFVRPDKVPQLADAERFVSAIESNFSDSDRKASKLSALYLNAKGFERASKHKVLELEPWLYTSAQAGFLQNNTDESAAAHQERLRSWAEFYKSKNFGYLKAMVSTAFGSVDEGIISEAQIVNLFGELQEIQLGTGLLFNEICLADTAGVASPRQVSIFVNALRKYFPKAAPSLHLHDTRGMGIANIHSALQEGVDIFETSLGGLGGCPFLEGASGNVATEELLYLCESLGIETPSSLKQYEEAILASRKLFDFSFPSKLAETFR